MTEDDEERGKARGKLAPENRGNSPDNVVPFERGKSFPASGNDLATIKLEGEGFWSPEKVEFLRATLENYMEAQNLTPQNLYDLIKAPEINANIEKSLREDGIRLTRAQARPDQDDKSRDIIRNWIKRYPFAVSEDFLKYADRFVRQNGLHRKSEAARSKAIASRIAYHLSALRDIFSDIDFSPVPLEQFRLPDQCTFEILDGYREPVALLSIWFSADLTGHFVIIRPNELIPLEKFRQALSGKDYFQLHDMILATRGYVVPHHMHEPPKYAQYEIVFSALYVETFETILPSVGGRWFGSKKQAVPFQDTLTIRCDESRPQGTDTLLKPVRLESFDSIPLESFSFLGQSSTALRLNPTFDRRMKSLEKFAFGGSNV